VTLIRNRADRIHARRKGALARIGLKRTDTEARRAATNHENLVLLERTKREPAARLTRKKLNDPSCSEARKARRRGKMER